MEKYIEINTGVLKMTLHELTDYIQCGREIEFEYNDKKYSITYGERNNVEFISFCEFYKNSLDVRSPKELWNAEYNGIPIRKILENMSNASIWIF